MKKILIILGIIALLAFAACSQEETPTTEEENELPIIDDPLNIENQEQQTQELPEILAIVNGEEIYKDEVLNFQAEMKARGAELSIQETLDNVITRKILIQEANRRGLEATKETVEEIIEREGITREMVEIQGLNYDEFIEQQMNMPDIGISLLLQDALENVNVTDEMAQEVYETQANEINETFEEVKDLIKDLLAKQQAETQVLDLAQELSSQAEVEVFIT